MFNFNSISPENAKVLFEMTEELTKTKQEFQEVKSLNKNLSEQLNLANRSIMEIKKINNNVYDENDKLIAQVEKLKDETIILSFKQEELQKTVKILESNLEENSNELTGTKQECQTVLSANEKLSEENEKLSSKVQLHLKSGNELMKTPKKPHSSKNLRKRKCHDEIADTSYPCPICKYTFTQKRNLYTHIKVVHEGKKAFKCDKCQKQFGIGSSLTSHIKTVHEKKRDYKCEKCSSAFGCSSNLKRHITSHHR